MFQLTCVEWKSIKQRPQHKRKNLSRTHARKIEPRKFQIFFFFWKQEGMCDALLVFREKRKWFLSPLLRIKLNLRWRCSVEADTLSMISISTRERIEMALNKSNSQLRWLLRSTADCLACYQWKVKEEHFLSSLVTKGMVEMQYQAVNHTTFDTIKTFATMIT